MTTVSFQGDTGDDLSIDRSIGDDSQLSASAYEGKDGEMPSFVYFGEKECRVLFDYQSDKGAFRRVCGRVHDECRRTGHQSVAAERAVKN